jgi:hypothetical protein
MKVFATLIVSKAVYYCTEKNCSRNRVAPDVHFSMHVCSPLMTVHDRFKVKR